MVETRTQKDTKLDQATTGEALKRDLKEFKGDNKLEENEAKRQKMDENANPTMADNIVDAAQKMKETVVDAAAATANALSETVQMAKEAIVGSDTEKISEEEVDKRAKDLSDKVEEQRNEAMKKQDVAADKIQDAKEAVSDTAEKVKEKAVETKDTYKEALVGEPSAKESEKKNA